MSKPDYSRLPKMDRVLDEPVLAQSPWRRDVIKTVVTDLLTDLRTGLREGRIAEVPGADVLAEQASARLTLWSKPRPQRVLNATGVILHTNIGRAPISSEAVRAMGQAAMACDLEVDLPSGKRGSRFTALAPLLRLALATEDAHVVNNNAAALLLACTVLGDPGGVVISRGQLVEIGDGFRVATMSAAGGCRVVCVGSTNRTHLADYEQALEGTGPDDDGVPASAIVWVHLSNFAQTGFVSEVPLSELSALARAKGVPLIADLGSGSLGGGIPDAEPTVQHYLRQGADLVLCSGDKLMGGPQAGVLAGVHTLVQRCRRHPMARALRPDKTTLAALHATFAAHLRADGPNLPLHRMVTTDVLALEVRGAAILSALGWRAESVVTTRATIGGGSLPGDTIDSRALVVPTDRPDKTARALRLAELPVIGRIEDGKLLLDLRTILPEDDEALVAVLRATV